VSATVRSWNSLKKRHIEMSNTGGGAPHGGVELNDARRRLQAVGGLAEVRKG